MPFQASVNLNQAAGRAGDIFGDGPTRAFSYVLNSGSQANTYGNAFTLDSEGIAKVGGTGEFVGVLVNSNTGVSYGTTSGSLAPTMNAPEDSQGDLLTMGRVWCSMATSSTIGNQVIFNQTTGALDSIVSGGSVPSGWTLMPNAKIDRYDNAVAGLALVTLTN